jgi:hypothetical protein
MSATPIPTVPVTVHLPQPLHRRAKAQAAMNGVSLRDFVRQAVEAKLKGEKKATGTS